MMRGAARRRARSIALPALAAALTSCAGAGAGAYPAMPAPDALPPGSPLLSASLGRTDAWLRHYVMQGQPDSALALLDVRSRVKPGDELLRELQRGAVLHYAGRWEESNAAFEWAEQEAAQRWTRRLTQQAGQLLVNDAVVDYVPAAGEMALIPYYRMLNYLALGSSDGALVEARKASAWMERLQDAGEKAPCVGDGFVHYLAGVAFRGAGERNDALVSYRQAERAFGACAGEQAAEAPAWLGEELYRAAVEAGVREVADSAAARYRLPASAARRGDDGELVVFVENGWVAHRAGADIHVPIYPDNLEGVDPRDREGVMMAAARVVARLAGNLQEQAYWGEALDERPEYQLADMASGAYVLKMAWPVFRLEACEAPRVRVVVDGRVMEPPVVEDVSAVMFRRWEPQRAGTLSRMVARGMVRYMATREVERRARKKDETLGWLAGRVGNVAGNALERADTRSWSLLPDRIGVARLTLPPGAHVVRLEVMGDDAAPARTLDLGTVTIQPRGTLILSRRVWGSEMGDVHRLAARRPGKGDLKSAAADANR